METQADGAPARPGGDLATTTDAHAARPGQDTRPVPSPRTPPADDRSPGHAGVVSARRAFALVTLSLGVLALLRTPAAVHAGEGMPPGRTRDTVLAVARPLDRVTRPLGLDRPGERLAALFGHDRADSHSELATAASREASATGSGPGGTISGGAPTAPAPVPPRIPTAGDPLRVLVTGDSLTESLGPRIVNTAPRTVRATTDTRFGTGLVRPDFFDWASHAHDQLDQEDPEAVVVALGANDGQGITLPAGAVLPAGSAGWLDEYRRRALVLLRIWTDGGTRRVYWTSLPPARSDRLDGFFRQLNGAVADAARQVPGARFLDLAPALSDHGRYSDYLRDPAGHTVQARTRDGVHLTLDGARLAAAPILAALAADFSLESPIPRQAG
ncbi:SGNH/GDSL hydrolase family protein [Frankia nepalensis]|uniref:SGNH/GDSL hydrolase family protein n=1 Tax=Frankia nepalensis TaxID=1836974 RepID=UPI0027DE7C22|nr:DUF459 domain-containing protein [Frankia nepalensis]